MATSAGPTAPLPPAAKVRTVVPRSPNRRKKNGSIMTTKKIRVVWEVLTRRMSAPASSAKKIISFKPPGTAAKKEVRGSNRATRR